MTTGNLIKWAEKYCSLPQVQFEQEDKGPEENVCFWLVSTAVLPFRRHGLCLTWLDSHKKYPLPCSVHALNSGEKYILVLL